MIRVRSLCSALLLSGSIATAASAAHTHVPAPSTWTLNVKETDFRGGPTIKSDIDHVLADNEQHYHWEDVTVDGTGATTKTSWDGPEDGTLHPIQGLPGAKFSWNTATDSEQNVFADGTVYDAVLTLAPDGKTMTFNQTVKQPDGKTFQQKLVYERIK